MAKQSRAEYFREYRKRKREARETHTTTTVHYNSATGRTAPVASAATVPQQPAQPAQPRRSRVKSTEQIRAHIIGCLRQYSTSPMGLVNVLSGFVQELQDDMKRDAEASFAERVCERKHPGRSPSGVYCRLCHDVEMSREFGAIPTGPSQPVAAGSEEEQLLLDGVTIKTPKGE